MLWDMRLILECKVSVSFMFAAVLQSVPILSVLLMRQHLKVFGVKRQVISNFVTKLNVNVTYQYSENQFLSYFSECLWYERRTKLKMKTVAVPRTI